MIFKTTTYFKIVNIIFIILIFLVWINIIKSIIFFGKFDDIFYLFLSITLLLLLVFSIIFIVKTKIILEENNFIIYNGISKVNIKFEDIDLVKDNIFFIKILLKNKKTIDVSKIIYEKCNVLLKEIKHSIE